MFCSFQFIRQFTVRRRAYGHELMGKGLSGVLYLSIITTSIGPIGQHTLWKQHEFKAYYFHHFQNWSDDMKEHSWRAEWICRAIWTGCGQEKLHWVHLSGGEESKSSGPLEIPWHLIHLTLTWLQRYAVRVDNLSPREENGMLDQT